MPDKIMSILAEATGGKCTDKEILDLRSINSNPNQCVCRSDL